MYYIRKYSNCWAIHNDETGESRPLATEEVDAVLKEFPALADPKVRTIFTDAIDSINLNLACLKRTLS